MCVNNDYVVAEIAPARLDGQIHYFANIYLAQRLLKHRNTEGTLFCL